MFVVIMTHNVSVKNLVSYSTATVTVSDGWMTM